MAYLNSEKQKNYLLPRKKSFEGLTIQDLKGNYEITKLHKSTLGVPGKMYMLSGSTCNCNLAKPYLI